MWQAQKDPGISKKTTTRNWAPVQYMACMIKYEKTC